LFSVPQELRRAPSVVTSKLRLLSQPGDSGPGRGPVRRLPHLPSVDLPRHRPGKGTVKKNTHTQHVPPPHTHWRVDGRCGSIGPEADRRRSVSPVETGPGERRRRGEGGRAAPVRRVARLQTLPPSPERLEQLHHRERRRDMQH